MKPRKPNPKYAIPGAIGGSSKSRAKVRAGRRNIAKARVALAKARAARKRASK